MRTEKEIKTDLDAALIAYRARAPQEDATAVELRKLDAAVKVLQKELAARLSDGAVVCPQCKAAPHGMDRGSVYEVGCLVCPPSEVEADGQRRRISVSAQGRTSEAAVENWNAGTWLQQRWSEERGAWATV